MIATCQCNKWREVEHKNGFCLNCSHHVVWKSRKVIKNTDNEQDLDDYLVMTEFDYDFPIWDNEGEMYIET